MLASALMKKINLIENNLEKIKCQPGAFRLTEKIQQD